MIQGGVRGGPWPRPMSNRDRASEYIEMMPEDPLEQMRDLARRALEARTEEKMGRRKAEYELTLRDEVIKKLELENNALRDSMSELLWTMGI